MNQEHPFRDNAGSLRQQQKSQSFNDFNDREGGEHQPQISDTQHELVYTSMWTKVKNLESKYIDLANYYKGQAATHNENSMSMGSARGSQSSKSAVGGVVTQPQKDNSSPPGIKNEETIMAELKNEKIKFEQSMQALTNGGSLDSGLTTQDIARFNAELEGVFSEILTGIDQSQAIAVNHLSNRQTEMFQLATKHRLGSTFKNEAIGIWYDAKTNVSQAMQKLKLFVQQKGVSLVNQAAKPEGAAGSKAGFKEIITRFENDMVVLNRQTTDYTGTLKKFQQALKVMDDRISKEKNAASNDYQGLVGKLNSTNDMLLGRKPAEEVGDASNRLLQTMPSQNEALTISPFEKRIGSYTKGALNRSNSRGPQPSGSSISSLQNKPPKLGYQNSTPASRMASKGAGLLSPTSKNRRQDSLDIDWSSDLQEIKQSVGEYEASIHRYASHVQNKRELLEELLAVHEDQVLNNLQRFITTHDAHLVKEYFTNSVLTPTEIAKIVAKISVDAQNQSSKRNQASVSPMRRAGRTNSDMRKTTPTRVTPTRTKTHSKLSSTLSQHHTPTKSNQFNFDGGNDTQLYAELRRTNDKFIEQQVENRRLKDQVQLLSLQVEDLRLHNNRYQQQAANFQTQIAKQKRIKTSRPSATSYSNNGDQEDIYQEEITLCKQIDQFFTAMKLLQRAVNKKEDISELKVVFETKQRSLQKQSKAIQARGNTAGEIVSTLKNQRSSSFSKGIGLQKPVSASYRQQQITSSPMSKNRPKSTNKMLGISPKITKKFPLSQVQTNAQNSSRAVSEKVSMGEVQLEQQLHQARQTIQVLKQNNKLLPALRDKLVDRINQYEQNLNNQTLTLQKRLEKREAELDSVKNLFVQKLRELESNFAEIGDHLIANHEKQQQQAEADSGNMLRQVLSDANKTSESEDKAFDELVQTNAQLNDQLNELKQKFKEYVRQEELASVQTKLKEIEEENGALVSDKQQLVKMFDCLTKEKEAAVEEQSKSKQEKQLMQVSLASMKEQVQASKLEKEKQDMMIAESMEGIQQKLKDEISQKICFQKEAMENVQLVKLYTDENENMFATVEGLEMEKEQLLERHEKSQLQIQKLELENKEFEEKFDYVADQNELQIQSIKEDGELQVEELQLDLQEKIDQLQEEQTRSKAQYDKNEEIVVSLEKLELKISEKESEINDLTEQLKNQEIQQDEQKEDEINEVVEKQKQQIDEVVEQTTDAPLINESQLEDLQKEKQDLEKEMSQIKAQNKLFMAIQMKMKELIQNKLDKEIKLRQETEGQLQELQIEIDSKKAEIEMNKLQIDDKYAEFEEKNKDYEDLKAEVEINMLEIEDQKEENNILQQLVDEQNIKLDQNTETLSKVQNEKELEVQMGNEEIKRLQGELTEMTGDFKALKKELKKQTKEQEAAQIQLEKKEESIRKITETKKERVERIKTLEGEIKKFKIIVSDLENKNQDSSNVQSNIDEISKQLSDCNDKINQFEKDKMQMQNDTEDKINKHKQQLSEQDEKLVEKVEQSKEFEQKIDNLESQIKIQKQDFDEKVNKAEEKINELQNEAKNATNSTNEKIEKMQKEAINAAEALKALEQANKEKIDELENEVKKAQKALELANKETEKEEEKKVNSFNDTRKSIGSDGDEYSSVQEMKDHLKHVRQILIQFIQKLPFSSPDNEATLPVIYSMLEFTSEEQEKLTENRKIINLDKEVKDKSKSMFGKLLNKSGRASGRGSARNESFNSGGGGANNTSMQGNTKN